jgi:acyl-coenzyme A synthetase/AMP-(fatty) acid ligase
LEDFFLHLEHLRREALTKKDSHNLLSTLADLYFQLLTTTSPLPAPLISKADDLISKIHSDAPEEDFFHLLWLINARARYACFIQEDLLHAKKLALLGLGLSQHLWRKSFSNHDLEKKSYPLITALVLARIEGYQKHRKIAQDQMQNLLDFCENPLSTQLHYFPSEVQQIFSRHTKYWHQLLQGSHKEYFTAKIRQSLNKLELYRDLFESSDLLSALYRNANHFPNDIALRDHDSKESLSWRQWLSKAYELSGALDKLSTASPYIVICSRHSAFLPICLTACWLKNKTPLLVNDEITDIEFSRIKILLQDEQPHLVLDNDLSEAIKIKFQSFSSRCQSLEIPPGGALPPAQKISENSLALGLFTSGTSDLPKLILFTHKNLLASAQIEGENEGRFTKIANLRPPFTSGGLNTLWPGILLRSCHIFSESLRKRPIFRFLRNFLLEENPQLLVLSPAYLQILAESDDQEPLSPSPLSVYFGGNALPPTTVQLLQARGFRLFMRYGMTEIGHIISRIPADQSHLSQQSVGFAFKKFEIKSEKEFLQIRSPGAANFRMVQGQLIPLKINHWFTTEDRGNVTSDQEILLFGREHTILCVDGFRFHAKQVEMALLSSLWLKDCRIVGSPDPLHGQKITAFCIPQMMSSDQELEQKLRAYAQAHLSPPLRPSRYEFLERYPVLSNGKLNYSELHLKLESIAKSKDH